MKKILRNQSGVSMVQMLIAGGIMAGVSMGVVKITEDSKKNVNKVASDAELRSFVSQLKTFLTDEKVCKSAFNGKSIKDQYNEFTSLDIQLSNGTPKNIAAKGKKIEGYPNWKVTGLAFEKFIPTFSDFAGECRLLVGVERIQSSFGSKTHTKAITLSCFLDEATKSKIETCSSVSSNTAGYWVPRTVDGKKVLSYVGISGESPKISVGHPSSSKPSLQITDENASAWQGSAVYKSGIELPVGYVVSWGDLGIVRNASDCLEVLKGNEVLFKYCKDQITSFKPMKVTGDLTSTTQVCVNSNCHKFAAKNCEVGELVMGIKADGNPDCIKLACDTPNQFVTGIDTVNRKAKCGTWVAQ